MLWCQYYVLDVKHERTWAVSDCKRILGGHPGITGQGLVRWLLQHLWLLSRLLLTSRVYVFWSPRDRVVPSPSWGRLCISDMSLVFRFPFFTGSQLAGSLGKGPALTHSPLLPSAAHSEWRLILQAQMAHGAGAWIIAVVFWLLLRLVHQTNHSQISLTEISFHMRISSVVVVRCTDWRQPGFSSISAIH